MKMLSIVILVMTTCWVHAVSTNRFDYLKTTAIDLGGTVRTNWAAGDGDFLKDGSVPMSGNLNFGNNRGVNLAAGTVGTHAVNLAQLNATNALNVTAAITNGLVSYVAMTSYVGGATNGLAGLNRVNVFTQANTFSNLDVLGILTANVIYSQTVSNQVLWTSNAVINAVGGVTALTVKGYTNSPGYGGELIKIVNYKDELQGYLGYRDQDGGGPGIKITGKTVVGGANFQVLENGISMDALYGVALTSGDHINLQNVWGFYPSGAVNAGGGYVTNSADAIVASGLVTLQQLRGMTNFGSLSVSNLNIMSGVRLNGVTLFSGWVTNASSLSTNIEIFVEGLCTNVIRNP